MMEVARVSKCALQVQAKKRRLEQVTERLEDKGAMCVVEALFGACAFINCFCNVREDK